MNLRDQILNNFKKGSVLTRLIYVNLGFFIVVRLLIAFISLGGGESKVVLDWLALPADISRLITRPWSVITYMFLHYDFFHLLFNLIALYWFGKLFSNYIYDNKLLSVYLLGGLSGGAAYFISYNVFPGLEAVNSEAMVIGASGSVFAILLALAMIAPRHKVYIPFISQIELRWLVAVFIGIDILSLPGGNTGGHIAHLGGALFGYLFAVQHRKGNDITNWFENIINSLQSMFKGGSRMRVTYNQPGSKKSKKRPESDMEYNARKKAEQDEINRILDKVAESGYDSLTKKEKETLFKHSSRK